ASLVAILEGLGVQIEWGVKATPDGYGLGRDKQALWVPASDDTFVIYIRKPKPSGRAIFILLHEMGHTLGFRHPNQNQYGQRGSICAAPLPCSACDNGSDIAVMCSSLQSGLDPTNPLEPWDQSALSNNFNSQASFDTGYLTHLPIDELPFHRCTDTPLGGALACTGATVSWKIDADLGGGVASCSGPTINTQPQSVTIDEGDSTTLTVAATASEGSLSYQWYQGTSGTTTTPVGGNSSSLTVSPVVNTSYWARVTDGCGTTPSVNSATATVTVNPAVGPKVTSVTPNFGPETGGTVVTIAGSGFEIGTTVSFGGSAAVVVFVSSSELTATTSPRAAGTVSVTASNLDGSSGTLSSGFTYQIVAGVAGDANGDTSVSVSDIFYLINYLFASGPAPVGDGDANNDTSVTVSDIFFLINYLFAGGQAPSATTEIASAQSTVGTPRSSIMIGDGIVRRGQDTVRVPVDVSGGFTEAIAIRVSVFSNAVSGVRLLPAAGGIFNHSLPGSEGASMILVRGNGGDGVIGELELDLRRSLYPGETIEIVVDPTVSAVGSADGRTVGTIANGALTITNGTITSVEGVRPQVQRER
ncbi:MAG: IPT/TIG domain-containing protein, partial [Acidobacteria bacterium]|nr:IPT/TIG domain-containing protein [Acidobacteriota bacterium]